MKGYLLALLPTAAGWKKGHAVKNDVNMLQSVL